MTPPQRSLALLALPLFLPMATAWVRRREHAGLPRGISLTEAPLADARALGVLHPERVRLLRVERIATFEGPLLRPLAWATQHAFGRTIGLTLRYLILIRADSWNDRGLVAHELAHVAQYERLGGIYPFLRVYLRECLDSGYPFGALEQEAIREAARVTSA